MGEMAEKAGEVVETSAEILEGAEQLMENGGDLQEVVEQTVELVEEVQEVVEETQEVVEETREILNETEKFIEKFEAVEKYRKESEHNGLAAAATGVDIVIHAAEDLVEEELEELVEEKTEVKEEKVEEKKEEAYDYRANDEETCEQVATEDEADAEAYYRENGLVKESDVVKEVAEDTKSIVSVYASVGDESKTVFKAGEALTNGHGGAEVENFDIDVNGQVVEGGVVVVEDKVSLTGSVRSIKSVKSRSGSVKSTRSSVRSSVRSV